MITASQYALYLDKIQKDKLIHCWTCGYVFQLANDPYYMLTQSSSKQDKRYKELFFCKECWVNMAGEEWTIETKEDPFPMEPIVPIGPYPINPCKQNTLSLNSVVALITSGRNIQKLYCPNCTLCVADDVNFINSFYLFYKNCSTWNCRFCRLDQTSITYDL